MGKMTHNHTAPAIVFPARQTNSLGVIRSLGRRGVQVIGLDCVPMSVGFRSRYCSGMQCPDPVRDEGSFIDFLVELGKSLGTRGVLFLMDDFYVFLTTKHRARIENHFLFPYLEPDTLHHCLDKRKMMESARALNIPVPDSYWPESREEMEEVAKHIPYPVIIKPVGKFEIKGNEARDIYRFFRRFGKARRVTGAKELAQLWEETRRMGLSTLIQHEILGDASRLYSLGAYCTGNSEMLAAFTGRKLRQIPLDFGTCTLAEGCHAPELVAYGRAYLNAIRFRGIAEMEFKKDPEDGRFKFLEINPRAWTWISLATACGVDLPYIAYRDLTGQAVEAPCQIENPVKWINLAQDVLCYIRYGRGDQFTKGLSLAQWLGSLRGPKTDIYFDRSDPLPGVFIPLQLLRSRFKGTETSF